jgi:hypothetical protein
MAPQLLRFVRWLRGALGRLAWLFFLALLLESSSPPLADRMARVRAFTRSIEFDFVSWTLDALGIKIAQFALGTSNSLSIEKRKEAVLEYLDLVAEIQRSEARLFDIFADPQIADPQAASAEVRKKLDELAGRRAHLAPLAESILQNQLSLVLADMGLALGGQTIPPVLYHSTPLPLALIVSPRQAIRQDMDVSLLPNLSIDERAALEDQVDRSLDVSSLVVPIGGIGFYPTMIFQTTDMNYLAEVVAHEWIHNYLTLRPLGLNYLTSPELRTMNETAASIAGKEIGLALIERFYPERVPPPPAPPDPQTSQPAEEEPPAEPVFSFNAEMRTTRVTVDELLAAGKVEEAEAYMEERRRFFWENGYHLRKLNQAFFAFYGAYADQPGGAAGEDPVGAAVRALRAHSSTLADFINRIGWMSSFDQLKGAVAGNP